MDVFKQSCHATIQETNVLYTCTFFKANFEHEYYLTVLPRKYMHSLAKLRFFSHKLRIESGRYGESRIERDERYCVFCCKRDVEDEYHFVLVCCLYEELRKKYLKRYFYQKPSVYNMLPLCVKLNMCCNEEFVNSSY